MIKLIIVSGRRSDVEDLCVTSESERDEESGWVSVSVISF
jgi:hypothetical protein